MCNKNCVQQRFYEMAKAGVYLEELVFAFLLFFQIFLSIFSVYL